MSTDTHNVKQSKVLQPRNRPSSGEKNGKDRKDVVTISVTTLRRYTITAAVAIVRNWLDTADGSTPPVGAIGEVLEHVERRLKQTREGSKRHYAKHPRGPR